MKIPCPNCQNTLHYPRSANALKIRRCDTCNIVMCDSCRVGGECKGCYVKIAKNRELEMYYADKKADMIKSAAFLFLFLMLAFSASALDMLENQPQLSNNIQTFDTLNSYRIAFNFTCNSSSTARNFTTLNLKRLSPITYTPTDDMRLYLFENSPTSNNPDNSVFTGSIAQIFPNYNLTANFADYNFTWATPFTCSAGSVYWIVFNNTIIDGTNGVAVVAIDTNMPEQVAVIDDVPLSGWALTRSMPMQPYFINYGYSTLINTPPSTPVVYAPVNGSLHINETIGFNFSSFDTDGNTPINFSVTINGAWNFTTTTNISVWTAGYGHYRAGITAIDSLGAASNTTIIDFTLAEAPDYGLFSPGQCPNNTTNEILTAGLVFVFLVASFVLSKKYIKIPALEVFIGSAMIWFGAAYLDCAFFLSVILMALGFSMAMMALFHK